MTPHLYVTKIFIYLAGSSSEVKADEAINASSPTQALTSSVPHTVNGENSSAPPPPIHAPIPIWNVQLQPVAGPSSAPYKSLLISSASTHEIPSSGGVVFGSIVSLTFDSSRSGSISPFSPAVIPNNTGDSVEEITWQFGTVGLETPSPSPSPSLLPHPPQVHPLMPLQPSDVLSPLSLSPGPSYLQQYQHSAQYFPSALSNQYPPPLPPPGTG